MALPACCWHHQHLGVSCYLCHNFPTNQNWVSEESANEKPVWSDILAVWWAQYFYHWLCSLAQARSWGLLRFYSNVRFAAPTQWPGMWPMLQCEERDQGDSWHTDLPRSHRRESTCYHQYHIVKLQSRSSVRREIRVIAMLINPGHTREREHLLSPVSYFI